MRYVVEATIKYKTRFAGHREELEKTATESLVESLAIAGIRNASIKLKSITTRNKPKGIKKISWVKLLKDIDADFSIDVSVSGKNKRAKMNNQRFALFRENNQCVCCGIVGCVVLVEMHNGDENPHLNLYASVGGELILMTRDHIHPRCRGGKDHLSNYQTMCSFCNSLKGHSSLKLVDLKKLKSIHDKNKKASGKKLHLMIEEAKVKLSSRFQGLLKESEYRSNNMITMTDVAVYKDARGNLHGKPLCGSKISRCNYIGNIRRGTAVLPLFCFGQNLECDIGGSVVLLPKSILGQSEMKGENHGKMGKRT